MDPVAEIKKLYFNATKATIQNDVARAIELLKALPTEDERERAAVYMDGLSQMRSEWSASRPGGTTSAPPSGASVPRGAAPPGRSGPSKGASRRSR